MSYHVSWIQPSYTVGGLEWIDCRSGSIPPKAVKAGEDCDGGMVYVGRAFHQGDTLPAKICPQKESAYVSYDGEEIPKWEYQALCSKHIAWKPTESDNIPQNAIQIGKTAEGEPLYVGRTYVNGLMTPGKVHPSHKCLYIPFDGEEMSFEEFEILIFN